MAIKSNAGTIEINGYPIYYEKFGTGSQVVLLIPGAMGIPRNDFKPQLEGPNAFDLKRYTFIGVDLPGWGRSRPPVRQFGPEVYNIDADCCLKLMESLGYKTFSIIGWSDGAKVALVMCHRNPTPIQCAIVISIVIEANEKTLGAFQMTRDINIWPKEKLDEYIEVYGNENSIQLLWDQNLRWIRDAMDMKFKTEDNPNQFILKPEELKSLRTPVLIIQGVKDPLVAMEQPLLCQKLIPGADLCKMADGAHNCHQACAAQFKEVVEIFFEGSDVLI